MTSVAKGIALNGATGNVYATRDGLTIVKAGAGSGTVTSAPSGIDCGPKCAAEFEEGKLVHLAAAAAPNSKFIGWSALAGNPGTCIGTTSPCDVTMSAAIELKAQFDLRPAAVVSALDPSQGSTAGANMVAIEGSGLANASSVAFGSTVIDDAEFIQNTDSLIEVKAPGHAAGTVHVVVRTGAGISANFANDDYTYEVPAPPAPKPPTTTTSPIPSSPPAPPGCLVPKLAGLTLAKAKSALSKAHCSGGEVRKPKGKATGPLIVKSSKPAAAASLPANSEIDLVLGPKPKSRKGGSK